MKHLLVTNDYPPKVGGIQSYLWELWRRLDPDDVTVLCTPHEGDHAFDAAAPHRIERTRDPVLLPHPGLARRIETLARDCGAELLVLDPALPLSLLGPSLGQRLGLPWVIVLHGAEITVPGRIPLSAPLLRRVLRAADGVVAAGGYPLAEAERAAGGPLRNVVVPPGVDTADIVPLTAEERVDVRRRLGVGDQSALVFGLSRLVPRKGFDVLIEAVHALARQGADVALAIAGDGRDRRRLHRLAAQGPGHIELLGRVSDAHRAEYYGAADVFAMLCRDRWLGLEQEGFGIVFLEAAAAGVPALAGRSGGSHEAVAHGDTGLVVDDPEDATAVAAALARLVNRPDERRGMGAEARRRVERDFDYDVLAERLGRALEAFGAGREVVG
ncbi:MAG: glycosyltransferase family 4 protein [Microthrixaceae bacterium]